MCISVEERESERDVRQAALTASNNMIFARSSHLLTIQTQTHHTQTHCWSVRLLECAIFLGIVLVCLCSCLCKRDNMGGGCCVFSSVPVGYLESSNTFGVCEKKKDANLAENFVCLNCGMAPSLRLD